MKLSLMPLENDELIRVRCEGLVSLRGLDLNAEPLGDLLGGHCYAHKVLLNLEKAQGIDTSGLTWLNRANRKFQSANGALVLYSVPAVVSRVFHFVRLGETLPIAASEAAAEDAVNPPNGKHAADAREGLRPENDRTVRLSV
jgi:anti-anti-sigma regulatory factor